MPPGWSSSPGAGMVPFPGWLMEGRRREALELLGDYLDWYGPEGVYVELQQNLLQGDTGRNRELAAPCPRGGRTGGGHQRRALPLSGALQVAARPGGRQAQHHHRPGPPLHQAQPPPVPEDPRPRWRACSASTPRPSPTPSVSLKGVPSTSVTDLGYTLPDPEVPRGYTAESYLRRLCLEADPEALRPGD